MWWWWTFLFWFYYRLCMAILAHGVWFFSMHFNCLYFQLWKSYDLLWFWMHLILCTCFQPLRRNNYLLVWSNLIYHKYWKTPDRTFRQLYYQLYRNFKTKTVRRLEQIELDETGENGQNNRNGEIDSDPVDSGNNVNGQNALRNGNAEIDDEVVGEDRLESKNDEETSSARIQYLYPSVSVEIERRQTKNEQNNVTTELNNVLVSQLRHVDDFRPDENESSAQNNDKKSQKSLDAAVLKPDKEEKKQSKMERKEAKRSEKEALRAKAKEEAREGQLAGAVQLLLFLLRLRVSFAMLIGNIGKTFLAINSPQTAHDDSVRVVFQVTVFLDIALFWFSCQYAYCRQCRLFCQLGLRKFCLWLAVLGLVGGLAMELPMLLLHNRLDITWCRLQT